MWMEKTLNSETKESLTEKFYNMAQIPPKNFYKLTKEEQVNEAVRRMNIFYDAYEQWKKISITARKHQIPEPQEIDRPDLLELKS